MNRFFIGFVKATGWPAQFLCFRTKVYYQNKKVQNRRIKGPAILISNHTSVFDFAVFMYVFISRILRYQMAEILFKKNRFMTFTLKKLGGIFVDRYSHNFSFLGKSEDILDKGGIVGIFPESRLPVAGEERPLPFKPSAAYLAMTSRAPVIPVYTNGSYFTFPRTRVIIGTPIYAEDYINERLTEKENIENISNIFRNKILELRDELERQS